VYGVYATTANFFRNRNVQYSKIAVPARGVCSWISGDLHRLTTQLHGILHHHHNRDPLLFVVLSSVASGTNDNYSFKRAAAIKEWADPSPAGCSKGN